MTWTPYGTAPLGLQNKAMRSISADEAYALASPAQRRQWFGESSPTKDAGQHNPAAAGSGSHLTPELQAKLAQFEAATIGDQREPVCPTCRSAFAPGHGTVNGYCAHRFPPGLKAVMLAEARQREATRLEQQAKAGMLGDPVRVVPIDQAIQEDSVRAELHARVEGLFGY